MEQEKIINIEELVQDEHNFNKGTDEGGKLMERSFKEMGAGRSVLIDKHGKIIAGNKSQKAAIAAGIKRVRVIETTGDELIAVKRTDVELESEQGRKMALLDNLTTQVNLAWDVRAPFTQGGGLRRGCGVPDFMFDCKPVNDLRKEYNIPHIEDCDDEEIKDIHLTDEQYEKLEEIIGGGNVYFRDENNVGFDGVLYFSTILKAGKYLNSIVHSIPTEEEINKLMDDLRKENEL